MIPGFRTALLLLSAIGASAAARPVPEALRFAPDGDVADAPHGFVEMCRRDAVLCAAGNRLAAAPASPAVLRAAWFGNAAPAAPCPPPSPVRLIGFGGPATDCAPAADFAAAPVAAPVERRAALRLLRRVNGRVNTHVWQVPDIYTGVGEERWQRPAPARGSLGDCEDIAIDKRMRLIEAGFPANRLFFAVAFKRGLGVHTVLAVRLGDGDYVLDSASPHVLRWDKTRYRWLRLQTPGQPLRWTRAVPRAAVPPLAGAEQAVSADGRRG